MDKEKDETPPTPSPSISPTQGYYGPGNPYYPPFIMPQNAYPNPYTCDWDSQLPLMPHFAPTIPYPLSNNPDEFTQVQHTYQVLKLKRILEVHHTRLIRAVT